MRTFTIVSMIASMLLIGSTITCASTPFSSLAESLPRALSARAVSDELEVTLETTASDSWNVTVRIKNTLNTPVLALDWFSPLHPVLFGEGTFNVTDDTGAAVEYSGILARVQAPASANFRTLAANETVVVNIDLSYGYEFEAGRQYKVSLAEDATMFTLGGQLSVNLDLIAGWGDLGAALASMTHATIGTPDVQVAFTPTAASIPPQTQLDPPSAAVVPSSKLGADMELLYTTQNCAGHTGDISSAVSKIRSEMNTAYRYFEARCESTLYTEWFGAHTSSRYSEARSTMISSNNLLQGDNYEFYCDAPQCEPRVYAYVYKQDTTSHTMHLCDAWFDSASDDVGFNSKPGILLHEATHFADTGSTNDHAYGTSACRDLAENEPDLAVNNADNFEYFLEDGIELCPAAALQFTDECADSDNVLRAFCGEGTASGSTASSSSSSSYSSDCATTSSSPDVFFRFTAPETGVATFETANALFDPVLMLVNDECNTTLECDNDGGTLMQSRLEVSVTKGQQYAVRVTSEDGSTGDFDLLYSSPKSQCSGALALLPTPWLVLLSAIYVIGVPLLS